MKLTVLSCPSCEDVFGHLCLDDAIHTVLETECKACGRWMRLFINELGIYRSQYPLDVEGIEKMHGR